MFPTMILPLFIYLTSFIHINLTNTVEELLIAISGSFIMGLGYSLMYKEGYKTGAIIILEDIYNDISGRNTRILSRGFDVILIIVVAVFYGIEQALYSSLTIVIIR